MLRENLRKQHSLHFVITKNRLPLSIWLRHKKGALSLFLRLRIGGLCYHAMERFKDYQARQAYAGKERLEDNDIRSLIGLQTEQVDRSWRNRATTWQITDDSLCSNQSIYTQAAAEVLKILGADQEVSTAINIGARVDVVSAYLAPKFPNIRFTSVDIQPNLAEHNSTLPQNPNWRFVSGYALDLLERGEISGDIAIFTSTACLFTNKEWHAYCEALSRSARYVVLNEPFTPFVKGGRILGMDRPEEIEPDRSEIGSQHPAKPGGTLYFMHNYPKIFEQHGFDVVRSELVVSPFGVRKAPRIIVTARRAS